MQVADPLATDGGYRDTETKQKVAVEAPVSSLMIEAEGLTKR